MVMSIVINTRCLAFPKRGVSLAFLLMAGLASAPAISVEPVKAAPQPAASPQSAKNLGGAGLRAFIDPATGKLHEPSAEEIQQLNQQIETNLPRNDAVMGTPQPVERLHPSGAVSVELDESTMSYAVAKVNPDGSVSTACDTEAGSPEQALKNLDKPNAKATGGKHHDH
jgi:hypothetical protein